MVLFSGSVNVSHYYYGKYSLLNSECITAVKINMIVMFRIFLGYLGLMYYTITIFGEYFKE